MAVDLLVSPHLFFSGLFGGKDTWSIHRYTDRDEFLSRSGEWVATYRDVLFASEAAARLSFSSRQELDGTDFDLDHVVYHSAVASEET